MVRRAGRGAGATGEAKGRPEPAAGGRHACKRSGGARHLWRWGCGCVAGPAAAVQAQVGWQRQAADSRWVDRPRQLALLPGSRRCRAAGRPWPARHATSTPAARCGRRMLPEPPLLKLHHAACALRGRGVQTGGEVDRVIQRHGNNLLGDLGVPRLRLSLGCRHRRRVALPPGLLAHAKAKCGGVAALRYWLRRGQRQRQLWGAGGRHGQRRWRGRRRRRSGHRFGGPLHAASAGRLPLHLRGALTRRIPAASAHAAAATLSALPPAAPAARLLRLLLVVGRAARGSLRTADAALGTAANRALCLLDRTLAAFATRASGAPVAPRALALRGGICKGSPKGRHFLLLLLLCRHPGLPAAVVNPSPAAAALLARLLLAIPSSPACAAAISPCTAGAGTSILACLLVALRKPCRGLIRLSVPGPRCGLRPCIPAGRTCRRLLGRCLLWLLMAATICLHC